MGEMYEEILLAVRSPGFIVILQEESPFPKRKASEIMMEKSQSIFWVRLPKFRELQKRSSGSEEWILLIIHRQDPKQFDANSLREWLACSDLDLMKN
ncbi:uncharacterized protein ACIQIH_012973 isoform 3-T7 [Cyanocitta cristata]